MVEWVKHHPHPHTHTHSHYPHTHPTSATLFLPIYNVCVSEISLLTLLSTWHICYYPLTLYWCLLFLRPAGYPVHDHAADSSAGSHRWRAGPGARLQRFWRHPGEEWVPRYVVRWRHLTAAQLRRRRRVEQAPWQQWHRHSVNQTVNWRSPDGHMRSRDVMWGRSREVQIANGSVASSVR